MINPRVTAQFIAARADLTNAKKNCPAQWPGKFGGGSAKN
jgi:hypothetical protein